MASRNKTGPDVPARSAPVSVRRRVQVIDDGKSYLDLAFPTVDGKRGTYRISSSQQDKPGEVLSALRDQGAALPIKAEAIPLIADALAETPRTVLRATKRLGWVSASYVQPHWTEPSNGPRYMRPAPRPADAKSGTLLGWREGLREPCCHSDILSFVIGVAFAGPVMHLVGEDEGAIFNVCGASTSGKSLAGRACQSVSMKAAKNALATFDVTDRRFDELCEMRCDSALVLDEEGRAGCTKVGETKKQRFSFALTSGRSAERSAAVQATLPDLQWRCLGVTSSERSLDATRLRTDGEKARAHDIPVQRHGFGIFKPSVETVEKATELAAKIEAALEGNYAVALRPFIKFLVRDPSAAGSRAKEMIAEFVRAAVPDGDSLKCRSARKFALVEAGMVLAAEAKVAPWRTDAVRPTVMAIYRSAHPERDPIATAADTVLSTLSRELGTAALPTLRKGEPLPAEAIGFERTLSPHGSIIALRPTAFADMIPENTCANVVLDHLLARGAAIRSPAGKRRVQIKVGGLKEARPRFVVFHRKALPQRSDEAY